MFKTSLLHKIPLPDLLPDFGQHTEAMHDMWKVEDFVGQGDGDALQRLYFALFTRSSIGHAKTLFAVAETIAKLFGHESDAADMLRHPSEVHTANTSDHHSSSVYMRSSLSMHRSRRKPPGPEPSSAIGMVALSLLQGAGTCGPEEDGRASADRLTEVEAGHVS